MFQSHHRQTHLSVAIVSVLLLFIAPLHVFSLNCCTLFRFYLSSCFCPGRLHLHLGLESNREKEISKIKYKQWNIVETFSGSSDGAWGVDGGRQPFNLYCNSQLSPVGGAHRSHKVWPLYSSAQQRVCVKCSGMLPPHTTLDTNDGLKNI